MAETGIAGGGGCNVTNSDPQTIRFTGQKVNTKILTELSCIRS